MYSFYLYVDCHHQVAFCNLITFMKYSTNNKAETMYTAFMEGVQRFGLPSRVCSDQGREKTLKLLGIFYDIVAVIAPVC